jgi:hypothetical protein
VSVAPPPRLPTPGGPRDWLGQSRAVPGCADQCHRGDGAKVSKTYHSPATPYQRLLTDARTSEDVRRHAIATYATLDPVRFLKTIREVQQELVALADRPVVDKATEPSASTLEQFLSGLRTAWQEDEVRPTGKPKEKVPRGRRRPDPFARVTELLQEWFEAEPWRTSGELFERLQKSHPDLFPDGQLRTLQRRVKTWRRTRWSSGRPPRERCPGRHCSTLLTR